MATYKEVFTFPSIKLDTAQMATSADGRLVVVPAAGFTQISVQATNAGSVAWSTGSLALRCSMYKGGPWASCPAGGITINPDGVYGPVDVSSLQYLAFEITVAEANVKIDLAICGYGDK